MPLTLRDRLDRLRREPPPGPLEPAPGPPLQKDTGELDRLEQRLLGQVQAELPLRERLMRLAAAAARGRGAPAVERAAAPPPVPLEELVAGARVANERGEFFRIEDDVHLETHHGAVPLSRFRLPAPGSVEVLAGDAGLDGFDLSRAVFLDTETTGLAGGTGTAAFLVGIGFVDGDRFRVRQYFMRDYHEEPALLHGLAEDLARFTHVVTFNGKQFDLPLLETRFHLARERYPLRAAPHLDLLHPARRLWKRRLASCTLQHLEQDLLGLWRRGDVAGSEIPQLYFDYVRRRDARAMARIFRHNRTDVVSLAALAVVACQWVEEERAEDPRDVLSLARVLERAGRAE
ncbi:MAG TPA: ribonuclease H-like domain-containing protein, partial [Vicinamibacteria bacterium]